MNKNNKNHRYHSIEKRLLREGFSFEFHQAVKLLEMMRKNRVSPGEGATPMRESVSLKSKVDLNFPPSEVDFISWPKPRKEKPEVIANFLGLAGALGPLPHAVTEMVMQRVQRKDTAFKDFLDIFNHRLLALFYRIRKLYRVGFDVKSPEESVFSRYLYSVIGMGTGGLQNRLGVKDRALLYYGSILSQRPPSASGLETILSHYFQVDARVAQFTGRWFHLREDQTTAIGRTGRNRRLGIDAAIGDRYWDQTAGFEVYIGPLTLKRYLDFLPCGSAWSPLAGLTRFYVGSDLSFHFVLMLKSAETPVTRLGAKGGARLGWTSWLGSGKESRLGKGYGTRLGRSSWIISRKDPNRKIQYGPDPDLRGNPRVRVGGR